MPLIPAEQNKSKVEQALKDMMAIFGIDAKIEIKELSCFGSYLKLGFLLLSVLLLYGYYLREGGHAFTPENWDALIRFASEKLK